MLSYVGLVVPFFFISWALSLRLDHRDPDTTFLSCYDYIIVGGGISGLVVANRLTEDPNGFTVLVLEAGDLDNYEDFIIYPFDDGEGLSSKYDWNLWTAPQIHLDGISRPYDMGRGVGGGSLINGMCWTRGGQADFDSWVELGNPGWGWDDLLPYFKKTENYTANVDAHFTRELFVEPDSSTHGTGGYIHVSYPRFFYSQSQLFLAGLRELGIPILTDPNNGTAAGGMIIPSSVSPDNQTRSDARTGYYDGFIENRPNFHLATGNLVTRVLIDAASYDSAAETPSGLAIAGVEFIPNGGTSTLNINCSREVILAAGNVHTPQILELSGIGQADILSQFNIPVAIDLPGVGNNFQDHPYVGVVYSYCNATYLTSSIIENNPGLLSETEQHYYVNKTGPWTAGPINTVAFPSLPSISKNWTNMITDASSQNAAQYLLSGLDATVVAGFTAQKALLVDLLIRTDVGAYEILNDNIGLIAVSAMHPFSRGNVHIQSSDPFVQPLIDPRYCSNPLDCQILVEALLFNNELINTTAMRLLEPEPYSPFLPDASPDTLMPAIRTGLRTEFHGSGATSMLPLELGGVVDTHLRVYGTQNLRVVDAGIMPLVPAAHLQAPVYAIAEKAADIIKADSMVLTPRHCVANSGSPPSVPLFSGIQVNASAVSTVVDFGSNTNKNFLTKSELSEFSVRIINVVSLVAELFLLSIDPPSEISTSNGRPGANNSQIDDANNITPTSWPFSSAHGRYSPSPVRYRAQTMANPTMDPHPTVRSDAIPVAASVLLPINSLSRLSFHSGFYETMTVAADVHQGSSIAGATSETLSSATSLELWSSPTSVE